MLLTDTDSTAFVFAFAFALFAPFFFIAGFGFEPEVKNNARSSYRLLR